MRNKHARRNEEREKDGKDGVQGRVKNIAEFTHLK